MAAEKITWLPAEYDPSAQVGLLGGCEASFAQDGTDWFWFVKATSEVSEWPEVWTSGTAKSEAGAKRSAGAALKKAAAYYKGSIGPGNPAYGS